MKRIVFGFLCLVAAYSVPVAAAEKIIRFGVNDHANTPYVEALSVFKETIEREAPGRLKVEIYPSNQLGSVPEMFENVQIGAQQMSVMAPAYASQFFQAFDVLELPYLISSTEQGNQLVQSDAFKNLMQEAEQALGVKLIGVMPIGFRHVANSRRPVRELEDFKGLKLRTQSSPVHLDAFGVLGAAPVAIDWGETYQAVQAGVVDGLENAMNILLSGGFPKIAKHISTTSHVYGLMIFSMNQDFFDSLDDEDKDLVLRAWMAAEKANQENLSKSEAEVRTALKDMGAEITELGPDQIAQLVAATQPVRDSYGKNFEPHYSALQAALEAP